MMLPTPTAPREVAERAAETWIRNLRLARRHGRLFLEHPMTSIPPLNRAEVATAFLGRDVDVTADLSGRGRDEIRGRVIAVGEILTMSRPGPVMVVAPAGAEHRAAVIGLRAVRRITERPA